MSGLGAFLLKMGLGVLAELLRAMVAEWRRERELEAKGYQNAVDDAGAEADARAARAEKVRADWDALSDVERERVRNNGGHYRD